MLAPGEWLEGGGSGWVAASSGVGCSCCCCCWREGGAAGGAGDAGLEDFLERIGEVTVTLDRRREKREARLGIFGGGGLVLVLVLVTMP